MQHNDFQLPRIVVLVLLAAGLGIAILQVDSARRADLVPAANAASSNGALATSPPAAPAGALVSDATAAAAAVPAPVPATASPAEVVPAPTPVAAPIARRRGGVTCDEPHRTVQVDRNTVIRANPNGRAVGTLPASSVYLGQSMTAWVQAVSPTVAGAA